MAGASRRVLSCPDDSEGLVRKGQAGLPTITVDLFFGCAGGIALYVRRSGGRQRHSGRGGGPHQRHFLGRQAVGLVDEVRQATLKPQGFRRGLAGGRNGVGVLAFEPSDFGGREVPAAWEHGSDRSGEAVGQVRPTDRWRTGSAGATNQANPALALTWGKRAALPFRPRSASAGAGSGQVAWQCERGPPRRSPLRARAKPARR